MATTDSDEILQSILKVSEQVSTLFANHIPHHDYDKIAAGLVALAASVEDHPRSKPIRMVIAGALAAVGHEQAG